MQGTYFHFGMQYLGSLDIPGDQFREFKAPFDMRHTNYLMIAKDPGPDDEFVYQPSARRVRRIALKKTDGICRLRNRAITRF